MTDPKFFKFIAKAVPLLEAELEAAARSRAFDGYQLLDAEMDDQVRKLHTLDAAMTRTQNEGLKVSWITWSPTGSIIGVCFEAEEHQDWCDHPSSLHIWNLNRRDFDPGNAYKVLQAPACLTSAEFHPQESGLIAAGGHFIIICSNYQKFETHCFVLFFELILGLFRSFWRSSRLECLEY